MEGTPEQQVQKLKEEYERRLAKIKSQTPEPPESKREDQTEANRILAEHQAVSETTEGIMKEQDSEFKASSHEPGHSVYELPQEAQVKIQEWVSMSLNDPSAGVKAAKGSDPSLFDALHGALTSNQVFTEMVKRGKLPELK